MYFSQQTFSSSLDPKESPVFFHWELSRANLYKSYRNYITVDKGIREFWLTLSAWNFLFVSRPKADQWGNLGHWADLPAFHTIFGVRVVRKNNRLVQVHNLADSDSVQFISWKLNWIQSSIQFTTGLKTWILSSVHYWIEKPGFSVQLSSKPV